LQKTGFTGRLRPSSGPYQFVGTGPVADMSDPAPPTREENLPRGNRLDSWKEIAAYLKRDVRTVQRWEKTEKLPVHRHLHEKQGTVYAFASQIDDWARGRRLPDDADGGAEKLSHGWIARIIGVIVRRRWWAVTVGVGIAAVAAYSMFWPPHRSVVLAVLPFKNLGGFEHDPLVDGFTGETTARLEKTQPDQMGVLLLGKKYAGMGVGDVARQFHADYVLTGTAHIVGQEVAIATRLVQVAPGGRTGATIWSNQYQGDLQHIQRIQSEVAAAIATAVLRQFKGAQPTQPLNPEAYEAHAWGTYFLNKRTTADLLKALGYFEKATEADPSYAPSYAGLAATYSLLGSAPYTQLPPKDSYSKAEAAARKALQLDESLAEAHLSLGYALLVYERNYDKARQEFQRAIQLRPGYATAHDYNAYYLTVMGEMSKAIEERETARKLDPVSPLLTTALGEAYYQNRQYDLAIQAAQKALELDASYPVSMINLARSYEQSGMHPQAEVIYLKLLSFAPEDPGVLALLGHAYAVSGRADKARKIEAQLEALRQKRYVAALYIAMIWTGLGERDQAFTWLDRAYEEDCEYLVYLRTEPMADPLRGDPRFAELLHKLGLPVS
jgi:tetratricopeptide (TPR) repeat protein